MCLSRLVWEREVLVSVSHGWEEEEEEEQGLGEMRRKEKGMLLMR